MDLHNELRYHSLSLVYLQIFTAQQMDLSRLAAEHFAKIEDNSIDRQIFYTDTAYGNPVERFRMQDFDFSLHLRETDVSIKGKMFVEMSVFFNRTVSLSYRMVIDGKICTASEPLSTDHVIALAALHTGAEHWSVDDDKAFSTINLDVSDILVDNFHLDKNGKWLRENQSLPLEGCFSEIQRRYKKFILGSQHHPASRALAGIRDLHFVYLDVWEDIADKDGTFRALKEEEIISTIYHKHRQELVGLMSLYPFEWMYRTPESFGDVCGSNVAIDTDDLILVNQNMCVVFGTYGLRGGEAVPTDWEGHLRERDIYHVSWPEYLMILEMILAKKYTISTVSDLFLRNTLDVSSLQSTRRLIEQNAKMGLKATKILLQLDAVKYSRYISHKIMFERTTLRLEVEAQVRQLDETMSKIDKSLVNISEMRKLKQATLLNVILGIVSAASLFGILFQRVEVPFLEALGLGWMAGHFGLLIISFTLILIILSALGLVIFTFKNNKL